MWVEGIDVERRRPVWEALSDLWRDTELQEFEAQHIARVLAESRYTPQEIHDIFAFEVAPVVWMNLFPFYPSIPPVWAGFDADWLAEEVLKNIKRQRRSCLYRCYVRSKAGEWMRTLVVKEDWTRVLTAYESKSHELGAGLMQC